MMMRGRRRREEGGERRGEKKKRRKGGGGSKKIFTALTAFNFLLELKNKMNQDENYNMIFILIYNVFKWLYNDLMSSKKNDN